jgi:hypothetical protein
VACARTATAAPITFYFAGVVEEAGVALQPFPLGTPVSFLVTFDPEWPFPGTPFSPDLVHLNDSDGFYWKARVGSHEYTYREMFNVFGDWEPESNRLGVDGTVSASNFLGEPAIDGDWAWTPYAHSFSFQLSDASNQMGNWGFFRLIFEGRTSGGGPITSIRGNYTYAERVPTPSTAALIALGALALFGINRVWGAPRGQSSA